MPPPALPDELIEEVLLRVPPDDPASLVRAALANRRWCRLVADRTFRHRRHALHRAAPPPMLGFLCGVDWDHGNKQYAARFVPTSSCRPPRALHRGLQCFDARHGRVLLQAGNTYIDLVVWDPITDQRTELPRPPWYSYLESGGIKATVLCAATATGSCDHFGCHRGPFIVVLVGTEDDIIALDDDEVDDSERDDIFHNGEQWCQRDPKHMFSCIYSSESGLWSERTYAAHPDDMVALARSALVGNALYFLLCSYDRILRYDLGTQQMSLIRLPYVRTNTIYTDFVRTELTTLEDGRLGFARVEQSTELCLWSRDEGNDVEGWTLCKIIDLKDLFPHVVDSWSLKFCLVGFAESVCVAFVSLEDGTFTIDMKSGLMKKVDAGRSIGCAVPYINFCTPALEAPSMDDDERSAGISSCKDGCLKCIKS